MAAVELLDSVENRQDLVARLTPFARNAQPGSPFHRVTWVAYYGRPGVPSMGILGEMGIDPLVRRLDAQAQGYDDANGPLGVQPVFHLVYGMATRAAGRDGDHLSYLPDETTRRYVERAGREGFGVILDIQFGAADPAAAVVPALTWLAEPNVSLAIDPEFAMREPGQTLPGDPPGYLTAGEIAAIQTAAAEAIRKAGRQEPAVLVVHQFLESMLPDKELVRPAPGLDVVISADGYGSPATKIAKYNAFAPGADLTALKLFYRWDDPLLTPRQVLGIDRFPQTDTMAITPNLVIYQ